MAKERPQSLVCTRSDCPVARKVDNYSIFTLLRSRNHEFMNKLNYCMLQAAILLKPLNTSMFLAELLEIADGF